MNFQKFSFGQIRIDGVSYDHDVVIDRGEVRKRKKKASKKFREAFGHTPLSLEEEIPWKCRRLVVGTGNGALPVMKEVLALKAKRRKVELFIVPDGTSHRTAEAECRQNQRHSARNLLNASCSPARSSVHRRSPYYVGMLQRRGISSRSAVSSELGVMRTDSPRWIAPPRHGVYEEGTGHSRLVLPALHISQEKLQKREELFNLTHPTGILTRARH